MEAVAKGVDIMPSDNWHLDKRVPVAIVFTMLMQFAAVVWWVSATSVENRAENTTQNTRLAHLEQLIDKGQETQIAILERLARIEVQQNNQLETLERIYKALDDKADRRK